MREQTEKYIRFEWDTKALGLESPYIHIYPVVCMHVGSPQSDYRFIMEHLRRIKEDPAARWVYAGDGGECVLRGSKGDPYGQLLSPQCQMEMLLDILSPVRDKGLFGIRGNHGHRIYKESGLGFDHNLCSRLGIPYMGVAAFANFRVNRSSYDCYFHHGQDSGIHLSSKIKKAEDFTRFIDADALFTAHSHVAIELQPSTILSADNIGRKVRTRLRHQYICGSAYDSREGYAEDKAYPPLLPAYLSVRFDGSIVGGWPRHRQSAKIWRSDGSYQLRHDYVPKYATLRIE